MKSKIMIGILILSLLGTTVYIIYDKIFDYENEKTMEQELEKKLKKEKEEEEENEDNTFELDNADITDFINKINIINTFLYKSYPFRNINKIKNDDVLSFALNTIKKDLNIEGTIKGFSSDRIKTEVIKYLGSDYPLIIADINCSSNDGHLYKYNAINHNYEYVGEHAHENNTKFTNSKAYFQEGTYDKEDDLYIIKTRVLNSGECTGTCGPNKDFYSNFSFENMFYIIQTKKKEKTLIVYKEYKSKLPYYIYTFGKSKGGDYGLISVEYQNR